MRLTLLFNISTVFHIFLLILIVVHRFQLKQHLIFEKEDRNRGGGVQTGVCADVVYVD